MNTALWILYGVLGAFFLLVVVGMSLTTLQQLRTPREERKKQVLEELRRNETKTGATHVIRGYRLGVRDEAVRELAEANGYRWTDYYGRRLTFQRELPGSDGVRPAITSVAADATAASSSATTPDYAAFLARLAALTPDSSGTARLDLSGFSPANHKELAALADAHGWTYVGSTRQDGETGFLLARKGSETVTRNAEYFIKGPGIEELGRYPVAHDTAAQAEREFGVNPLSDRAFNEAAARYRTDTQACNRWAALFALPLLSLVGVVPITARLVGDGGTTAIVLIVVWAVLAAATVAGGVGLARAHGRRKTALAPYKRAYERVTHAVVHSGSGKNHRSTVDDNG